MLCAKTIPQPIVTIAQCDSIRASLSRKSQKRQRPLERGYNFVAIPRAATRKVRMKAIVCEAFGGPEVLALRDMPDPPPPAPGEVQVRIEARGVQYVDVLMLAGKYQFRPEPPFMPGNEGAGEVVAVGDGVTRFKIGDKIMSRHRLGAFAQLGNSRAEDCDPVPKGMSIEEAAVFRGAHHTAYHALMQRGRLKKGDWVLIHGAAGGIGIAAIQVAKLFGATVIATAITDEKRAICHEEGADYAIDYREGLRDRIKELTNDRGVDICYDPIGANVFDESLRCLAWGGRILVLGFLGGGPSTPRTNYLLIKGLEVIGVRLGGVTENQPEIGRANMAALVELASQGKLRPRISHRFPLEQAADAIQTVIDRKVIGKAVLVG
jgi:NADPH2:quinone reductase